MKLDRKVLIHSGGTKFYQIFTAWEDGVHAGAVITHWGKTRGGRDILPIEGGQVKVDWHPTALHAKMSADKICRAKQGRGYEPKDEEKVTSIGREGANTIFPSYVVEMLLERLPIDSDKAPAPVVEKKVKAKATVAEKPVVRPQSWGSW